jgi:hypothetical protein
VGRCLSLVQHQRWRLALRALLVASISVPYLAIAFGTLDGRPVASLDDAYITFQYARQIARGYPYYNDGDRPTTGMTSPPFGFLMAGFYLLGFTGERLVGLAVGLGPIWLGVMAWLTYRLARRLIGERVSRWWPLFAAALVLLTGSVQGASFNGMETGLFTVLTLVALEAFFVRRIERCALWLGLATPVRPEGLILAGLMWGVLLVENLVRYRTVPWRKLALLFAALLVGLLPSLINWALTGTPSAAGLDAKSWLLNVPRYPQEIARSVLTFYRRIVLGNFLGWVPLAPWFVPPGLLLLALLGWIGMGARRGMVAGRPADRVSHRGAAIGLPRPSRARGAGWRAVADGREESRSTWSGESLWIVARLHAREGGAVRVEVDGHDVGRWRYPPVPGE